MSTVDDLLALHGKAAAAWHANQSSRVVAAYDDGLERKELRAALESALRAEYGRGRRQGITDVHDKLRVEHEQAAEPVAWRDHVEQRLLTWRQRFVNRSGDQLALDDFMDKESLSDLIDFVCDEYAAPPKREPLAGCSDLRDAKWLDPECCEAGACQSLRFKNKREPLTEERCVALAREFSGNPVPAIASPELWFLRGIRAAERAHGIVDE